jgi:pimeloyl-ACP methyl ester carboxylesterase
MALVKRPDGVEIYWEERGEGPLVVVAIQFFGFPEILAGLIADLVRDHRVVCYHLRGTGKSTRQGPYDIETDAADLGGVIEDAGGSALVIAMGDGCNRAVKLAAARPELVTAVITPGGNPIGRKAAERTEGLAASDSVVEALLGMMEIDYRSALRTMLGTGNPDLDEERVQERVNLTVAHCPHEAAVPRMREWASDDSQEQARALGDRLWLLEHGRNPWFPIEVVSRTREFLPEAHVEEVPDGPMSRPDLTAAVVRQMTAAEPVPPGSTGVRISSPSGG